MRLLALHVAPVAALGALALWFGLVDTPAFGEGRCASCGVEGYVVAAHVAVGLLLGGLIAAGASHGRRTNLALALVALGGVLGMVWSAAFSVYALAALVGSLGVAPLVLVWSAVATPAILRGAPRAHEVHGALTRAWLALVVLLPGLFAAVWLDRVDWFVF